MEARTTSAPPPPVATRSTAHHLQLLLLVALSAASLLACGGGTTVICDPVCPDGFQCTESGCVPLGARDLSMGSVDLSPSCSPACSGLAAHCSDKGVCVPCLTDDHCPTGQVCRSLGNTTACLPGCKDDSRCGGGAMKCCNGGCTDTGKDAANCGACGTVCSGTNSRALCQGGQCAVSGCHAGWGDCNMDAKDGCETNLRSDPDNCMACGMACALKNANAGCASGCYIRACAFGWDDCNGNEADGCELAVASDINNCGACGNRCPAVPHARSSCVNASCQLVSCDVGWTDCDGNLANGCEVATGSDVTNCGACGNRCAIGLVCVGGMCTCPVCNLPNAKSACVNLKCAVASCNANWGDCDGLPQNGCERALSADAMNCGACGQACAQGLVCVNGSCTCPNCMRANARTACRNNQCVLDSCFAGWGNCDGNDANGCETDVTQDRNNCGACGMVCPMNNPFCANGMCTQLNNNILIVYSSSYEADVKNMLVKTGAFMAVDDFNAGQGTPTLQQLQPYGAILVYSDGGFNSAVNLGNVVADYYDAGGSVVVATFANASVAIGGRFGTVGNGYMLVQPGGQEQPNDSLGQVLEPNSPLMVGVNKISATSAYRSTGGAINGGVVVAQWNSGKPMVVRGVVKGRNMVTLNFYPPSTGARNDFVGGDVGTLLKNALLYR